MALFGSGGANMAPFLRPVVRKITLNFCCNLHSTFFNRKSGFLIRKSGFFLGNRPSQSELPPRVAVAERIFAIDSQPTLYAATNPVPLRLFSLDKGCY